MATLDDFGIQAVFYDAETGEEIEGIDFYLQFPVSVGDEIRYWQENIAAGQGSIRRDFIVKRVRHDLRYMPPRGGRARYIQTLELFVTPDRAES